MLMESTERHIIGPDPDNHVIGGAQKCMFPAMIEDWKLFNPQDTTKHDLSMSDGWALVGADDLRFRFVMQEKHTSNEGAKWIKKHKLPSKGGRRRR